MNSIISALAAWTVVAAVSAATCPGGGGGNDSSPCYDCGHQPGCFNVTSAPYTLSANIIAESPYNEIFSIRNSFTQTLDSACFTFYKKDSSTVIAFRGLRFINGSTDVEVYVLADVENAPGTIRFQGLTTSSGCSTLVTQQCILARPCDGLYVIYRCDLYYGKGNTDTTIQDTRYAVSSLANGPTGSGCYATAIAAAEAEDFGGNDDFYCFPNRLAKHCVASFNGAPCVNAGQVDSADAVSLP